MTYVDPFGSNPVPPAVINPGDIQRLNAAQAASSAMVQPRRATIARSVMGFNEWGAQYSGAKYFKGLPAFSALAGMSRGSQTILRKGYEENIPLTRGMSPLGTILEGHHPWEDFKSQPIGTMASWANRETYGVRTLATRFPESWTRFDSTNIFNTEHENLYWNPWQLSTNVNPILKRLPGMQGLDPFTPGTMSMMSASSTMMRNGINPTSFEGAASTIANTNPMYAAQLGMNNLDLAADNNMAYALTGANSGIISSRAAGLFAGAKAGLGGTELPPQIMSAARTASVGGGNFADTAEWASAVGSDINAAGGVVSYARAASADEGIMGGVSALGRGGLVKGGSMLGDALPMLGGAALIGQGFFLGKGIGSLISKPIGGAIKFGEDAIKSFKGNIDKPVFGMGFTPTEATITARQRGVMAIQNSRLNARSWLGSEASSMWGHFG